MSNFKKIKFCPVQSLLNVIGSKWAVIILWHLQDGGIRTGDFLRRIPSISQKVLTHELRNLEKNGIINRSVYPTIPPKVTYTLTDTGKKLSPLLADIGVWVNKNLK